MPEELQAPDRLPLRISIGEMHADITQRRRAQNRVGDGMRQHIGIRVPVEAKLARNENAAQDERSFGRGAMNIPPQSGSIVRHAGFTVSCSWNSRARSISPGRVILIFLSDPSTTLTSIWSR